MQTINGVRIPQEGRRFAERLAYENQEVDEKIIAAVNALSIDDEFKPLVAEVVVRRAYEYKLSMKEIDRDLSHLKNNLKSIEIGDMPEKYKNASGLYTPSEKKITLRASYFKELMDKPGGKIKAFQTLAHELFHAMSHDDYGRELLLHVNGYTTIDGKPAYNNAILEGIIEKASHRVAYSTADEKAAPYNTKAFGYGGMTYVIDALAASCGVTDKAFMRVAFNGYDEVIKLLSHSSNRTPYETAKFLDGIDANAAVLHAIYYPNPSLPKISKRLQPKMVKEALENIEVMTREFFDERISRREVNGSNLRLLAARDKYQYNKLKDALKEGESYASWRMRKRYDKKIAKSKSVQKKDRHLKKIINHEDMVSRAKSLGEDRERLFKWAASGNLENYNLAKEHFPNLGGKDLSEFGVDLAKEPPEDYFPTTRVDIDNVGRRDFPHSRWYNDRVEEMVEKAIEAYDQKKAIDNTIGNNVNDNSLPAKTNFFSRIIGRIREAFGAGKNQNESSEQLEAQAQMLTSETKTDAPFFANEEEREKYNEIFGVVPESERPRLDNEQLKNNKNSNITSIEKDDTEIKEDEPDL